MLRMQRQASNRLWLRGAGHKPKSRLEVMPLTALPFWWFTEIGTGSWVMV